MALNLAHEYYVKGRWPVTYFPKNVNLRWSLSVMTQVV